MDKEICQQCSYHRNMSTVQLPLRLKPQCHLIYLGPVVQKEIIGNLNWTGEVQPTLYIFIIETEWKTYIA